MLFLFGLAGIAVLIFLLELARAFIQGSQIKQGKEEGGNRLNTHLPPPIHILWVFLRGPKSASETDWLKKLVDVSTLLVIAVGLYFAYDQAKKLSESIDSSDME